MTESLFRLAYSNRTARCVPASTDLVIDMTGVTPLPPQRANSGRPDSWGQNTPAGLVTSIWSPSRRWSRNQLETRPPVTRLTVTVRAPSSPGALDMEYDRNCSSPSMCTRKVQNCPGR